MALDLRLESAADLIFLLANQVHEIPDALLDILAVLDGDFLVQLEGEPAEIRVLKWNTLEAEKPAVFKENLSEVRLNEDGQLFVFAIVAESMDDEDISRPNDAYLRQYLGLSVEQQPLGQEDGGETGPILPVTDEPFSTEEPTEETPESDEPNDD